MELNQSGKYFSLLAKIFTLNSEQQQQLRGGDDFCCTSDCGSLLTHRSANKIEIITFLCRVGVILALYGQRGKGQKEPTTLFVKNHKIWFHRSYVSRYGQPSVTMGSSKSRLTNPEPEFIFILDTDARLSLLLLYFYVCLLKSPSLLGVLFLTKYTREMGDLWFMDLIGR